MLDTPEISSVFWPHKQPFLVFDLARLHILLYTARTGQNFTWGFTDALYNKYFLISTGNVFNIWPPSQYIFVVVDVFLRGGTEAGHNSGKSSSLCYWLIYRSPFTPPSFSAGKHSVYRGNPFQQDCSVWSCTLCYQTSFHLLLKSSRSLSKFH